jgi:CRP-like cAMP-binding protein
MAMLVETTYATTVIAMEPVRALRIGREALRTVMMMDPDIAAHFVAKLTSRMRQLTADLREVEENLAPRPPLELGETARPLLS